MRAGRNTTGAHIASTKYRYRKGQTGPSFPLTISNKWPE